MRIDAVRALPYDYNAGRQQDFSVKADIKANSDTRINAEANTAAADTENSEKKIIINEAAETARPSADVKKLADKAAGLSDLELLGRNADINKLDESGAVADSKKDQILSQYQYFAGGNSQNLAKDDAFLQNSMMNFSLS